MNKYNFFLKTFYNKKKEIYLKKTFEYNPIVFSCKSYNIFYKKKSFLIYNIFFNFKKNILSILYKLNGNKIFKLKKCGIVHRIDYNTSGIIIVSNTNFFYFYLKNLFLKRKVKKYYLVSFKSNIKIKKKFKIKGYIKNKKLYMNSIKKSKYSSSLFKLILFSKKYLLICKILTGRKNQIKIHLNYLLNIKFSKINLIFWKLSFFYKNKKTYYSIIDKKTIKLMKKKKIIL
ncbi:pseudouridine synthase [Candidatus Vidania fulgoroideorum]